MSKRNVIWQTFLKHNEWNDFRGGVDMLKKKNVNTNKIGGMAYVVTLERN